MAKIDSLEELLRLCEHAEGVFALRKQSMEKASDSLSAVRYNTEKIEVLVCGGTGCKSSQSDLIIDNLRQEIKNTGMEGQITVIPVGCFGFCEKGPIVKIIPDNTFYIQVNPEDASDIIHTHLIEGKRINRLLYKDPVSGESVNDSKHMVFYRKQMRIALRNCGLINPENILDYFANNGYKALANAITSQSPERVIIEIKQSGLRGRGGGGFPTGNKWEIARLQQSSQKYVVCNADEGDPGAFMDRSILEGDPHSVIEAMAICGYCIGASKGLVYIRAEYPLAVHRLKIAIENAKAYGLLGNNILNTSFCFDIKIRYGAGAFVCGEETALIHSMEGKRGEPQSKPPYPTEKGYKGKPTNVNNVETLANIPVILNRGAQWFSSIGTKFSKGTKVFALAGKINNVGLIEIPMGTTLQEVIFEIGEGIRNGKKFKAVQTGGPSGGCLTAKHLHLPIDYDTLLEAGSMMGSGGMIVMDEDDCMVAVARFYLDFTVDESCGKCSPCRIGNRRLFEILDQIIRGKSQESDIEQLYNLAKVIKDTSLCGLGQTSPNPVLSTITHFRDEYMTHIRDKRCPTRKCKELLFYYIMPEKCTGCTICSRKCPVNAIQGEIKQVHQIIQEKCIKCGICMAICKFKAITTQ